MNCILSAPVNPSICLHLANISAYAYKSRRRPSHERENPARATGKRRTLPLHGIAKGVATNLAALRYGARAERPEDDAACDTGGNRAFRADDGRRTGRRVGDGRRRSCSHLEAAHPPKPPPDPRHSPRPPPPPHPPSPLRT